MKEGDVAAAVPAIRRHDGLLENLCWKTY